MAPNEDFLVKHLSINLNRDSVGYVLDYFSVFLNSMSPLAGLDIDRWPGGFFYSAGQFGLVDLALHWPEGASERTFGPQGSSFCAGPKCKSDRDVAVI